MSLLYPLDRGVRVCYFYNTGSMYNHICLGFRVYIHRDVCVTFTIRAIIRMRVT